MKELFVYKKLENTPMIGPFTIPELLITSFLSVLFFVMLNAVDYYLLKISTLYTILVPIIFFALATSVRIYMYSKGKDFFQDILSKIYPKNIEGGTFYAQKMLKK